MGNTLEIEVAKNIMEKKVVQLPYCTKSESDMYYDKITNEGKSIRVEPRSNLIRTFDFHCTNSIEISEEEFNTKFNEVIDNIKNLNK